MDIIHDIRSYTVRPSYNTVHFLPNLSIPNPTASEAYDKKQFILKSTHHVAHWRTLLEPHENNMIRHDWSDDCHEIGISVGNPQTHNEAKSLSLGSQVNVDVLTEIRASEY